MSQLGQCTHVIAAPGVTGAAVAGVPGEACGAGVPGAAICCCESASADAALMWRGRFPLQLLSCSFRPWALLSSLLHLVQTIGAACGGGGTASGGAAASGGGAAGSAVAAVAAGASDAAAVFLQWRACDRKARSVSKVLGQSGH